MNRNNYKRLGDYIRPVDVRNRDLAVTNLLGVSISKTFIPSIANTIGTDMSTYKIVEPYQFAYGPVTSRNGDKITFALYKGAEKCIISQAYETFEIFDKERLLPDYLMMWALRPEFDRYARFKSNGSAREVFSWDEMCEVYLPVPDIAVQRKIVAEYQAVEARIAANERMISKLEETAQAIYKKMFVDDIDPAHLPSGWRISTINAFCKKIMSGGTPNRGIEEYWKGGTIPWIKTGEVHDNIIFSAEEYITEAALANSSAKLIPAGTVVMAMYGGGTIANVGFLQFETATNQACCNMICNSYSHAAFLFFHVLYHQEEIRRLANGGAQENLSQDVIGRTPIIIPSDSFDYSPFTKVLDAVIVYSKEIEREKEVLTLLLSRLS
jgi:type I restriction enzyme, S subunit